MADDDAQIATDPLRTVLEQAGVRNLREVAAKPISEIMADLDRMAIPPSEALVGALVLNAVHELREATGRLDTGTSRLLTLTWALIILAGLTLATPIVTLVASA
ncbi:MAG: hypothetical protein M3389_03985 [Actinomycetota bacterium]|nr:hypothetical protein [Actinomycetota bacterium]